MEASLNRRREPPLPEPPPPGPAGVSAEDLYEAHFAFVWRSLRALGVPVLTLDDAVQEVFLVALRRSADFEGRSSAKTWLFGIALRVASNVRRSIRRRPQHDELPGSFPSEAPSPEQSAANAEDVLFVERFLAGVDEDQRAAFIACTLEELSVREAAEALGVNANTLTSRLRLVRAKFQAALAERGVKR